MEVSSITARRPVRVEFWDRALTEKLHETQAASDLLHLVAQEEISPVMNAAPNSSPMVERYHPRVEANFMVKVVLQGRSVLVKARDLSMAGLYLHAHPSPGVDRLTVGVPLPDDKEIVVTCKVRRLEDDGVALEFDELDWEDLFALARYLHPRLR